MIVYKKYQDKCDCYKAAKPIKPVGILVHSTGANNPWLHRYVDNELWVGKNKYENHWNRAGLTTQVHGFIGKNANGTVAVHENLPQNIACWGCGRGKKGSYNYDPTAYLQFEICEQQGDKDYFEEAFGVAIEYCAELCIKYGWTEKNITSHIEAAKAGYASNHGDPEHWMKQYGKDMDWFRNEVKLCIAQKKNVKVLYRVGTDWKNGRCINQTGAFYNLKNAKGFCKAGQKVYDEYGNVVFPE